jgi:hypothetical protein
MEKQNLELKEEKHATQKEKSGTQRSTGLSIIFG